MKTLGPLFQKMALKMIKKHYLEKVFATRFRNVKNTYKTNEKQGFSEVIPACSKPL